MATSIKTSALSSDYILNKATDYVIFLDTGDLSQGPSGSTKRFPVSAMDVSVWGLSANYNIDKIVPTFTTVRDSSANWNSVYTSYNTNSANYTNTFNATKSFSANWNSVYTTYNANSATSGGGVVGGTKNQILVKNTSTDYDYTWKNKRVSHTFPTVLSTSSIYVDATVADRFVVPLSSNGTPYSAIFFPPTNGYDAQTIQWSIKYRTNVSTVALSTGFRLPSTVLGWSLSANKLDILSAQYDATDNQWDVVGFLPGYNL